MPKNAKNGKKKSSKSKSKLTLINLKVSSKDRAMLLAKAKRYENGNLSAWLRRAGLQFAVKTRAA